MAVRSDRRSDPSSEGLLGAREVTIHRWVARVRRMWKGGMFGVLSSRRTEPVVPERDRPTMDPRLVALAGLISAIAFVIIVLPGLASDEPSHWQTVLDYGRYLHLPRLGTPGVSYEAQQGPVAYVVGGIIYRLTHALIGPAGAFYTVRVLGALEFAALILLGLRLVRQTATSRLGVTAALVYLGLNPMLLAMFSSVQNDGLCLLLGFGALAYVLSRSPGTIAVGDATVAGVLVGLAFLTKETAWSLAIAVPLFWLLRDGLRRAWGALCAFGGALVVIDGWWFIRNEVLYGNLLGRASRSIHGVTSLRPPRHTRSTGSPAPCMSSKMQSPIMVLHLGAVAYGDVTYLSEVGG